MPPSQLILWSQGRTACHLLERMLSNQPNSKGLWHPFVQCRYAQIPMFSNDAAISGIDQDLRKAYDTRIAEGVAAWEKALQEAQSNGQMLFVHEHPQFAVDPQIAVDWAAKGWNSATYSGGKNFTLIPDELILKPGTVAVFTTRHPSWIIPAACRALRDIEHSDNRTNLLIICNLHWQRQLYDWYVSKGVKAIIVEAEDYMTNPDIVRKLCSEAGMDPERALFHWPEATAEEIAALPPFAADLLHSLLHSTGLIPSKAKPAPVLEDEQKAWAEEFGVEFAALMRQMVDASVGDYEYMRERKLRL